MLALKKVSINQFLNHLVGAGRAVCCPLCLRHRVQCWCAACPRDTTDTLMQQSSFSPFFSETNSLTGTVRKQPLFMKDPGIFLVLFSFFFFLLSFIQSSKYQPLINISFPLLLPCKYHFFLK